MRPNPWASRSPTILPAWSPPTASSPRCRRATAPARASGSIRRCWRRPCRSSARTRRAYFENGEVAQPRHPHPYRAGFCLRRRRRQAVRHPPVVAGEILERPYPRGRSPRMARGSEVQSAQDRGRRTTTRCTARCSEVFAARSREHWLRRLTEEDVPSGPLYDFAEVFADPQVRGAGDAGEGAASEAAAMSISSATGCGFRTRRSASPVPRPISASIMTSCWAKRATEEGMIGDRFRATATAGARRRPFWQRRRPRRRRPSSTKASG